jgi:hypothetical protein
MDDLKNLLLNEAFSNYVVAIITLLAGAIGWMLATILHKRKPSIIRVEKWFEGPTIHMGSEIRDKIQITYEGQPIDNLHHSMLRIMNTGEAPAKDICLYFTLEGLGPDDFLEVTLTNINEVQQLTMNPLGSSHQLFTLEIPFLNPWKEHKDYLDVEFYAPKPVTVREVLGNGLGWSAKYIDKARPMKRVVDVMTSGTSGAVSVLARLVNRLVR